MGYKCIGIKAANYSNGNPQILMVKGIEGVDIAQPTSMQKIWTDKKSGNMLNYQLWRPIAPPGFVSLCDLPNFRTNKSNDDNDWSPPSPDIWCVAEKYCTQSTINQQIWNDAGSGAWQDGSIWSIDGTDFIVASGNHSKPNRTVWKLK